MPLLFSHVVFEEEVLDPVEGQEDSEVDVALLPAVPHHDLPQILVLGEVGVAEVELQLFSEVVQEEIELGVQLSGLFALLTFEANWLKVAADLLELGVDFSLLVVLEDGRLVVEVTSASKASAAPTSTAAAASPSATPSAASTTSASSPVVASSSAPAPPVVVVEAVVVLELLEGQLPHPVQRRWSPVGGATSGVSYLDRGRVLRSLDRLLRR